MDIAKTIRMAPGHYVVAVSGGVDSVVLLDILRSLPDLKLTVAHFDHGIRPDSYQDKMLVEKIAAMHKLPFVYSRGNLGHGASEEVARNARYEFLRKVQKQANADAIITAHHLDDVIETATHNLMRGTGRRGMSSLKSIDGILRPLLHLPKRHIVDYAKLNKLEWREDSTNADMRYRRNYIRHQLLPRLKMESPQKFEQLRTLIKRQAELNQAIDKGLSNLLHIQPSINTLNRHDVIMLPHNVGRDFVGEWLRQNGKREYGRKNLEAATIAIKVARPGTVLELSNAKSIKFTKKYAHLVSK